MDMSLHLLTDAEKRGAALALAHVRAHSDRLAKTADGRSRISVSRHEQTLLQHAARMVRQAADIVRRDLTPDLAPHDVRRAYEQD